MGSKVVVLLGLSLAVFLLIASEVTARELAETTTTSLDPMKAEKASGVAGYGYGHGGHGGGGYGHGGHGGGGGYGHGGHGGGGGGGGCKHGCCGHGYHGGCRCCSYEGETVDLSKP